MILAYKGFDRDLSCTSGANRFQYALDCWNEEPEANCRKNGFHCAENPLDCLNYYPEWKKSVYYLVAAGGDIDEDEVDSKISCTRLRLIKPLTLEEFVAHSMNYIWNHPLRKDHGSVRKERGTACNGFVIVRGKAPKAKGGMGDVLGFIKEERQSKRAGEMELYVVDGEKILPDTWYNIYGRPAQNPEKGAQAAG